MPKKRSRLIIQFPSEDDVRTFMDLCVTRGVMPGHIRVNEADALDTRGGATNLIVNNGRDPRPGRQVYPA